MRRFWVRVSHTSFRLLLIVHGGNIGAKTRYNLRVVETLVAARILARVLNLSPLLFAQNEKFTLREVFAAFLSSGEVKGQAEPSLNPEEIKVGLQKLLGEVERLRPQNLVRWDEGVQEVQEEVQGEQMGLTHEEMVQFSGLSPEEFQEVYLSWVEGQQRDSQQLRCTTGS